MIFSAILLFLDSYLTGTLLLPLYKSHFPIFTLGLLILQVFFLSLFWLYFVYFKSSAEQEISFEKPIQKFAFFGMGVLSFLFCFSLTRDLIALPLLYFGNAHLLYSAPVSALIFALSTICVLIGSFNARYKIFSPKVQISIQDLPSALEGFRVVQLSDVHLGTGPNPKQVGKLVDRALELKPDIITLTGDIIDGNTSEMEGELKELARLKAPHGVFFVLGNHECYWNHLDAIHSLEKLGITVLQNRGIELNVLNEKIFIAGMNDPAITQFKGEGPKITPVPKTSKINMMLVHQPHFAKEIAEHDYHLQLSGHTHGGQFFPWNFAVKRVHEFDRGLKKLKSLWVYVNMGSGYWGPAIRLGSQCEVTELVFVGR